MSLAQYNATKRYKERHRAEHLEACKRNYQKNKERYNKANSKRGKEITAGARRWRETVGKYYWTQKYGGYK